MASVLPRTPGTGVDLPPWESMRYAHAAMFCSFGDEDLATSDGAMKDRWLIKNLPGCSVTEDTTCDRPDGSKNCTAIFDDVNATNLDKASFWIFKAVVGVQSKLSKLRSRLKEETLFLDLELKSLNPKPKHRGSPRLLALGTITNIGFNLFNGLIDMTGDQTADEGDLQASLAKVSRSMGSNIDDMLSVAMGGGKGDDYDKLPIQSKGSYKNKVAQFFNTGFWLQNNDAGLVKEMMDAAILNLRAKMVDEILSANGWYVSWYVWRNSEDKCPKEQGFEWVKAGFEYYCVILMNSSWSGPDFAEDRIYKAMDNNGLRDRKAYYGSLVDCAKNGDGKFDAKSLTYGKIPKCFFHLKVIDFV
ncbi:unnamed protein product [Clonostachys rhizophaga]|uniref:Uncharacterized protein n=1 Tax=Clonostachys rhizophaga TaxID=160324 RepID=A0A9N9YS67_9HYPO|nr:unnamed protein product [Clonostachys rhizophaga]